MISLDNAVVYDIETLPNLFSLHVQPLFGDWEATFEISQYRDDRALLLQWFDHWRANQTPLIGFNSLAFDYPILHFLWGNPYATYWDIYQKAQEQIQDRTIFKTVRPSECFAPQIDLLKLWHFDKPCPHDQPEGAGIQHASAHGSRNAVTVRPPHCCGGRAECPYSVQQIRRGGDEAICAYQPRCNQVPY